MQQLSLLTPTPEPLNTRYEPPASSANDHTIHPFRLQEVRLSFTTSERPTILAASPQNIVAAFADLCTSVREQFYALFLNSSNEVIAVDHISTGDLTSTSASPAEIVRTGLLTGARSIILLHNHPGGNTHPSSEDIATTKAISEAAKIFNIAVLDHIIICRHNQYCSLRNEGLLTG